MEDKDNAEATAEAFEPEAVTDYDADLLIDALHLPRRNEQDGGNTAHGFGHFSARAIRCVAWIQGV